MQLSPFGRQQLHRTPLPVLSTLQFPQQAPSVERQWPLRVLKYADMYALQKAVSEEPDSPNGGYRAPVESHNCITAR